MSGLRRRVWWVLPATSIVIVTFGIGDVLQGVTADPGITLGLSGLTLADLEAQAPVGYRLYDFTTRSQGLALVVIGTLLTTIFAIPYRAGEGWAWAVAWVLPAWALTVSLMLAAWGVVPGQAPPPPMVSGPIVAVIAAVVLLVDRRRFAASTAALT